MEIFGMVFERVGAPRVAERSRDWLLVCDPPHQTAARFADAVTPSRGSISTMTGLLMQFGLVERIGLCGEPSRFYGTKSGGSTGLLKNKILASTEVRKMAERGLEFMKGEPPQGRRRLQECTDFYALFERELAALVKKREKERKRGKS